VEQRLSPSDSTNEKSPGYKEDNIFGREEKRKSTSNCERGTGQLKSTEKQKEDTVY
jgi:hypothetical protein